MKKAVLKSYKIVIIFVMVLSLLFLMSFVLGQSSECGDNICQVGENSNSCPADCSLTETEPNLKVAFIGDAGINSKAKNVLQLIKDEGAQLVIHSGDLGYDESDPTAPQRFEDQINSILGPNFPYIYSIGNHDKAQWDEYRQFMEDRINRIPELNCEGRDGLADLGSNSKCEYKGFFVILSGKAEKGDNHEQYMEGELIKDKSIWSASSWHKTKREMQIGNKDELVGWEIYEINRREGSLVMTGHEHTYERTKTLISMQNQEVDPDYPNPNIMRVKQGATFAVVSGIAGRDIGAHDRCLPIDYPYGCNGEWANIYTSDQNADFGALFIEFNVGGDPYKANAYFKDISNNIPDSFSLYSEIAQPKCGNNILEGAEQCDDGNNDNDDGCSAICTNEDLNPDRLIPTGDSYVRDTYPNNNYGRSSILAVDGVPIKNIYMMFDLTNYNTKKINSAILRLYIVDSSSSSQDVKRVEDNSWNEKTITYNNAPPLGSILKTLNGGNLGNWIEIDITPYVDEKKGQIMSFGIDSKGSDGLDFNSKEASSNNPELLIVAVDEISVCGNNIKEPGEVCDGTDLAGETCQSQGYDDGNLACSSDCLSFDTSLCYNYICGNGIKEGNEECDDGNNLNGDGCDEFCKLEPVCGDNKVEGNEVCDGDSQSCTNSDGYDGTQECNLTCDGWLECVSPYYCGDSIVQNPPEICDSNSQSCKTANGYDGTQDCDNNTCKVWLECTSNQYCGDDVCNGEETCSSCESDCGSCNVDKTFNPIADAHVEVKYPNNNYGSLSKLEIDGSPVKTSYFKFDLTSLAGNSIKSAKFRFYIVNPSKSNQEIKRVSDNSWTENGITYNNRPSLGAVLKNVNTGNQNNVWYEVDVTSYVDEKKGQIMSFGIDSKGSDGLDITSKEGTKKPELIVN